MRNCPLDTLRAVAPKRKPGYLDDVLKSAVSVTETHAVLSDEEFRRIHRQYALAPGEKRKPAPAAGPGTELKKLLKLVGITATPNCSCNKRARLMDENGCDWCEENLDTIVGWLREEATKRKLPFVDMAGRLLVKRAIRNARRAAS